MQAKRWSILEVAASTLIGFIIALSATSIVLPLFGFHSTFQQDVWITIIFTVISVMRGYLVRRLFNWINK